MTRARKRKRIASRAEARVAEDLGGRKVFNSGAGSEKSDAQVPHRTRIVDGAPVETTLLALRIEVKTTSLAGFTLKSQDWADVVGAADKAGQLPVFVVKMRTLGGLPVDLVVIRTAFFTELTGETPEYSLDKHRSLLDKHRSLWLDANTWVTLLRGQGVRRVLLDRPTSNKKSDVCLFSYDRFHELVRQVEKARQP